MPSIHVCPLSKIDAMVQVTGARSLITLLSAGTEVRRPDLVTHDRHLHLTVSDIVDHAEGHVLPSATHVSQLVAFAQRWDRRAPIVIHCYAGVSRSPAAAFIIVCALHPGQSEHEVALRLRRASPTATPNRRLVALADEFLRRDGRMVRSIAAIGTGATCFEGTAFELPLH